MKEAKDFVRLFSSKLDAIKALKYTINQMALFQIEDTENIELLKDVEAYDDRNMAQQALELWNNTTGQSRKDYGKISAVIKQIPKLTLDQIESVIVHKQVTWGKDPKMAEYMRPATIFGSKQKFLNYLDDATQYWITEQKRIAHEQGY